MRANNEYLLFHLQYTAPFYGAMLRKEIEPLLTALDEVEKLLSSKYFAGNYYFSFCQFFKYCFENNSSIYSDILQIFRLGRFQVLLMLAFIDKMKIFTWCTSFILEQEIARVLLTWWCGRGLNGSRRWVRCWDLSLAPNGIRNWWLGRRLCSQIPTWKPPPTRRTSLPPSSRARRMAPPMEMSAYNPPISEFIFLKSISTFIHKECLGISCKICG